MLLKDLSILLFCSLFLSKNILAATDNLNSVHPTLNDLLSDIKESVNYTLISEGFQKVVVDGQASLSRISNAVVDTVLDNIVAADLLADMDGHGHSINFTSIQDQIQQFLLCSLVDSDTKSVTTIDQIVDGVISIIGNEIAQSVELLDFSFEKQEFFVINTQQQQKERSRQLQALLVKDIEKCAEEILNDLQFGNIEIAMDKLEVHIDLGQQEVMEYIFSASYDNTTLRDQLIHLLASIYQAESWPTISLSMAYGPAYDANSTALLQLLSEVYIELSEEGLPTPGLSFAMSFVFVRQPSKMATIFQDSLKIAIAEGGCQGVGKIVSDAVNDYGGKNGSLFKAFKRVPEVYECLQ